MPATQPLFLSTLPTTRRQQRLALAVAGGLLLGCLAAAPFLGVAVATSDAFIPAVDMALFLADGLTAALLLAQSFVARSRALLALACGYLFAALLIVPHALTFPGAFAPDGLLGANSQTTLWIHAFWHLGLPAAVLAYVLLRDRDAAAPLRLDTVRPTIVATVGGTALAAVALTTLATVGADLLPVLMVDAQYSNPAWQLVAVAIVAVSAAALVLLWRRRRSVLDLWLLVVLFAWVIETALLGAAVDRFSVVWYAGRLYGLLAASVVPIVLLSQLTLLYSRLAHSMLARQRENENRIMTMDAVAASIAREVRQPLSAIVANGGAGLLRLQRQAPDLDEAREILRTIINDGMRVTDLISGVRALVKRGDADVARVDIAEVVSHALVVLHGDLHAHGVTVETSLNNRLPRIDANKAQLQQVFVNLVVNAIEAMDGVEAPRRLAVRNGCVNGEVFVDVEDSGPGVDAGARARIFEAFYTTKPRGAGMGLAICKSIVEAHRGKLWCSASDLRGAKFRVALPSRGDAPEVARGA